MIEKKFTISVIIPCHNEEKYIEKCISSVLLFNIPSDAVVNEIILVDGNSTDRTRQIINEFLKIDKRIILLDNPQIFQGSGLNIGIRKATGNWILRLDAHAEYPQNYISLLIETANRINAENIGGLVITQPGGRGIGAEIVQAITTHRFGVGNSGFRTGMKEGKSDTVPYGFFKKEIFGKIGYFDERLIRAQDYEFNRRIKKFGGKIWLNPAIRIRYYNQPDLISFLKKQFLKEAPYNAYMWFVASYTFAFRHAITAIFSLGMIGGLILSFFLKFIFQLYLIVILLYFLLALFSSFQQAIKYKKAYLVFILPFSFFLFHFIHGIGIWRGVIKIITNTAPVQQSKIPWPGYENFKPLWIR